MLLHTADADAKNQTPVGGGNPLPVAAYLTAGALPAGASALGASSGNKANAAATATLHPASGKTAYITGFQCTASGATAGLAVAVTVAGLAGGTQTFAFTYPAGVAVGAQPLVVQFAQPFPASAADTDIVVSLPASGAGGTNAAASAQGYCV